MVLGVVAIILLVAMVQSRGLWPLFGVDWTDRMIPKVSSRVTALQSALQDWYVFEYCSGRSEQFRTPLGSVSSVPAGTPSTADLSPYLPDEGSFLKKQDEGTYEWSISRNNAPPRIRIYWSAPGTRGEYDDFLEVAARRLAAECEQPGCKRLTWADHVATAQDYRRNLLSRWLSKHEIDCDADDPPNTLDDFCDSDGNRRLGPADGSGRINAPDGSSYVLRDLDRNNDGKLDYDFNQDLAVDAEDYKGWGC